MLACAIPERIGRPCLVPSRGIATTVGAVCGFAWAAALRAFMWEVAGDDAAAQWMETFLWVLLPGALLGALLAWAEHRRWTDPLPPPRWLVWLPALFAAALLQPLAPRSGVEAGTGLAAVAVPVLGMLGGYAIAGRGPLRVRALCGLATFSALPIWSLTATDVGGPSMSLGDPHGRWAALLSWGLQLVPLSVDEEVLRRRVRLLPRRRSAPGRRGPAIQYALEQAGLDRPGVQQDLSRHRPRRVPEQEDDGNDVVEGPDHGQELGDQVDGRQDPRDGDAEGDLGAAGDVGVSTQPAGGRDAGGEERCDVAQEAGWETAGQQDHDDPAEDPDRHGDHRPPDQHGGLGYGECQLAHPGGSGPTTRPSRLRCKAGRPRRPIAPSRSAAPPGRNSPTRAAVPPAASAPTSP